MLRDGFETTEWFVRRVNGGDADLKAGRVMSTQEVLAVIEAARFPWPPLAAGPYPLRAGFLRAFYALNERLKQATSMNDGGNHDPLGNRLRCLDDFRGDRPGIPDRVALDV
ncbi:MAG: hypothetical protein ABI423_00250 [Burkholderiales bacterium]